MKLFEFSIRTKESAKHGLWYTVRIVGYNEDEAWMRAKNVFEMAHPKQEVLTCQWGSTVDVDGVVV